MAFRQKIIWGGRAHINGRDVCLKLRIADRYLLRRQIVAGAAAFKLAIARMVVPGVMYGSRLRMVTIVALNWCGSAGRAILARIAATIGQCVAEEHKCH